MNKRKKTPENTETAILTKSFRRCALCYGLNNDIKTKRGQIAHIDHNPQNISEENLVWLCLSHHDQYDSKSSQSKNITVGELKNYKSKLFKAIESGALESIKSVDKTQKTYLNHDKNIFRRSNRILSEIHLREFIDELQTNDSYFKYCYTSVLRFREYFQQTGNKYINEKIANALEIFCTHLKDLSSFLSFNFFNVSEATVNEHDTRYCLHPHLNVDRGGDGKPENMKKYDDFQIKLDNLCKQTRDAYKDYRKEIKLTLFI
jgi:hypothetical protein